MRPSMGVAFRGVVVVVCDCVVSLSVGGVCSGVDARGGVGERKGCVGGPKRCYI